MKVQRNNVQFIGQPNKIQYHDVKTLHEPDLSIKIQKSIDDGIIVVWRKEEHFYFQRYGKFENLLTTGNFCILFSEQETPILLVKAFITFKISVVTILSFRFGWEIINVQEKERFSK